jgi:hypothetical protein
MFCHSQGDHFHNLVHLIEDKRYSYKWNGIMHRFLGALQSSLINEEPDVRMSYARDKEDKEGTKELITLRY